MSRLSVFKTTNIVGYNYWRPIEDDLRAQGITYSTGHFTAKENEQLIKNWNKLTKDFPFEDPGIILFKSIDDDKQKCVKEFIRETRFYIKLGNRINRPLHTVYNRARKLFNKGKRGRYTEDEENTLRKLENEMGKKWEDIGHLMGRSGRSLLKKSEKIKFGIKKGPWSEDEDNKLLFIMTNYYKQLLDGKCSSDVSNINNDNYNEDSNNNNVNNNNNNNLDETKKKTAHSEITEHSLYFKIPWARIADEMETRDGKQCRERWIQCCNVSLQKFDADVQSDNNNDNNNNDNNNIIIINSSGNGNNNGEKIFIELSRRLKPYTFNKLDNLKLVEIIVSLGVNTEANIDWYEVMKSFENIQSPQVLHQKWYSIKCRVPNYRMLSFEEVLEAAFTITAEDYEKENKNDHDDDCNKVCSNSDPNSNFDGDKMLPEKNNGFDSDGGVDQGQKKRNVSLISSPSSLPSDDNLKNCAVDYDIEKDISNHTQSSKKRIKDIMSDVDVDDGDIKKRRKNKSHKTKSMERLFEYGKRIVVDVGDSEHAADQTANESHPKKFKKKFNYSAADIKTIDNNNDGDNDNNKNNCDIENNNSKGSKRKKLSEKNHISEENSPLKKKLKANNCDKNDDDDNNECFILNEISPYKKKKQKIMKEATEEDGYVCQYINNGDDSNNDNSKSSKKKSKYKKIDDSMLSGKENETKIEAVDLDEIVDEIINSRDNSDTGYDVNSNNANDIDNFSDANITVSTSPKNKKKRKRKLYNLKNFLDMDE